MTDPQLTQQISSLMKILIHANDCLKDWKKVLFVLRFNFILDYVQNDLIIRLGSLLWHYCHLLLLTKHRVKLMLSM